MSVVSIPPHAVRAYIVSRDIACSLTILHLATRIADYEKKTRSSEEKISLIYG